MRFHLQIDDRSSYKVLGQLVRYHRIKNNYSLRDLSSLSNISHTLISNIEKAKVISSHETMVDLMKVLGITFQNTSDIKDRFIELYDEAFNFLFEYEYDKVDNVMELLFEKEEVYIDSIVASDYLALKYLYLALKDKIYGEYQNTIKTFLDVYDYLNDRQKQIFSFTYGVYMYNIGYYNDAYNYFKRAKSVGVRDLDKLVDVYIVKTFVKMYRFMDAISLSDDLIGELEFDLLYLRAMEVRLSIVYSYIIVQKFDDAFTLLDKVYRFAKMYDTKMILRESDMLYTAIYFKQNRFDLAWIKLSQNVEKSLFTYYLRMKLAYIRKDMEEVFKNVKLYREYNEYKNFAKSAYLLDIVLNDLEIEKHEEKELLKKFDYLITFAKKSIDLELTDSVYSLYINYCKKNRQYKKAMELSEEARGLRKYGVNYRINYK